MSHPSEITVMVVMIGQTAYWPLTRPFIENYCERNGYVFRVFSEDCLPSDHHPSWNKLLVASFAKTPHVLLWDADLVPLPWAPPIHVDLGDRRMAAVRITPSSGGRRKLRARYGREAAPQMTFNCGLISVPHKWKAFLRNLFFNANYDQSIFWEQGEFNRAVFDGEIKVDELDSKWNCWVSSPLNNDYLNANCLHFAKGSARRLRNLGRLYKMLRESGRLPEWVYRC